MINTDDISAAVVARCAAVSAFATAVPGKTWFGRGPDEPDAYPYAVHRVEADAAKVQSDGAYVQKFTLRVAAYAPVGAGGVDPQAVAQAMALALCTTAAQTALQGATLRNAGDKILHARVVSPKGEFDQTLRAGRDVFVCGVAVEMLCQGDGGAA